MRVTYPFDAVTHAQMGRIRPRGVWRGSGRGWEFPLAAADLLLERFGGRFRVEEELLSWLHWHRHPLPPLPHHRVLVASADLDQPLLDGRMPLPHQRSGARLSLIHI